MMIRILWQYSTCTKVRNDATLYQLRKYYRFKTKYVFGERAIQSDDDLPVYNLTFSSFTEVKLHLWLLSVRNSIQSIQSCVVIASFFNFCQRFVEINSLRLCENRQASRYFVFQISQVEFLFFVEAKIMNLCSQSSLKNKRNRGRKEEEPVNWFQFSTKLNILFERSLIIKLPSLRAERWRNVKKESWTLQDV